MQEIIQALQNIPGLFPEGANWQAAGQLDPQNIANALMEEFDFYGEEDEELPMLAPNLFKPIEKTSLQQLLGKTYTPLIETTSKPLLAELVSKMDSTKATKAAGGFAGSGGWKDYTAGAKDVYGQKMTGVLGQVGESKATAKASILDLINSWRQTATSRRYGGSGSVNV